MKLKQDDLDWAVRKGLLSDQKAERLRAALKERRAQATEEPQAPKEQDRRPASSAPPAQASSASSRLDLVSVAYYAGGLVAIAAMTWLLARVASLFDLGPVALALIALAYGAAFGAGGWILRFQKNLRVAGGLLFVVAVTTVPVAVFCLRPWMEPWIKRADLWLGQPGLLDVFSEDGLLEGIATVVAGAVALRYVRFPFLTAPVALALWWLAEFSIPKLLVGGLGWTAHLRVSVAFGAAMLMAAYVTDRRTDADYAFWGYLLGLLAFWGSLLGLLYDSEAGLLLFALANVALVLLAVLLDRRSFLVFGTLGTFGYLGHLAFEVFADTILFPLALAALGVGLIYLGIKYQRRRAAIERLLWSRLPPALRRLSPRQRGRQPS
ncbi:MAG: DUF2157 domain-containing protein [Salinibacter sp.]|uniref:DUF2157 domain-containing protein n=1 Tax=Salinibacter sp. TaxID=2065818 RepID=UPI0035D50F7B